MANSLNHPIPRKCQPRPLCGKFIKQQHSLLQVQRGVFLRFLYKLSFVLFFEHKKGAYITFCVTTTTA